MDSPRRIEDAIQRALVAWISDDIHIIATRNEDSRNFVDMGVDIGLTDLILFKSHKGILHILFLELKTKKGKLSESQKKWKKEKYDNVLSQRNTHYEVAYGFEEAKEKIISWIKQITS